MEEFQLYLEIDVKTPFKKQQKQEAVNQLINQLLVAGCKSAQLNEIYYVDRKSAENWHTIAVILDITAMIATVVSSAAQIWSELRSHKNKGVVFLKRKNGDYVKISEDMTAEEALKQLKKNEEKGKS